MNQLKKDLQINNDSFAKTLIKSINANFLTLDINKDIYRMSYYRIASLEAWKDFIFENLIKDESIKFYIEAQNDAVLSHVFHKIGSWRAALQILRSLLENILFFIYYKDRPVELELWKNEKHKLPISDYINYYCNHPRLIGKPSNITSRDLLKREYSTLSKAVHGSTINFRMTNQSFPSLMIPDVRRLNQGMNREKFVLLMINIIFINLLF